MIAKVSRGLVLASVAFQFGIQGASAQDGEQQQRPQSESIRLLSLDAQSKSPSGAALIIPLNEKGAADPRFGSFDAPFSLKNHFCAGITDIAKCDAVIDQQDVKFTFAGVQAAVAIRVNGKPEQPLKKGASSSEGTLSLKELRVDAGKDRRVDILIKVDGKAVNAISLTYGDRPQLKAHEFVKSATDELAIVRLDRTGVATTSFLNPRWPIFVDPDSSIGAKRYLTFVNRLSDRQFIVTFSGISSDNRWNFLNAELHLSQCDADKCNAVLVVAPGGTRRVPLDLLKAAYVKDEAAGAKVAKVVSFDVALLHEETQLANPRGYFSLVQFERLEQEAGGSTWNASVTGSYGFEPDLSDRRAKPDAPAIVTDTATRGQSNDHFFKGNFNVGLKQSLGGRANAEMELRLKSGAYGTDANVKPTKYRLNVFGVQGNTYSAGLFTVAEPSEGIAISVTGENAGVHYGFLDVNHIWRKYVPRLQETLLDFDAKAAEGDNSATLIQIKSAPKLTWAHGQLDLFTLVGRKHSTRCEELTALATCPSKPAVGAPAHPDSLKLKQWYFTSGGELTVRPRPGWGTAFAIFRSHLRLREGATEGYATAAHLPADNGDGTVWTLTGSWTSLDRAQLKNDFDVPARFTIRGHIGAGTGVTRDDPKNTAYIGDTATFAPDLLFLSVLAPTLQTERGLVGSGLSNKRYMSILYTSSQYSPLQWIAKALRIPSNDIDGQSTTVRIHDYRFVDWAAGLGKHAGTEVDMIFALDSPAKVTYSISLGAFQPGSAFRDTLVPNQDPLIRGFQYIAIGKVTVKM